MIEVELKSRLIKDGERILAIEITIGDKPFVVMGDQNVTDIPGLRHGSYVDGMVASERTPYSSAILKIDTC